MTGIVVVMGIVCYRMAVTMESTQLDGLGWALFAAMVVLGFGTGIAAMQMGIASFRTAEF